MRFLPLDDEHLDRKLVAVSDLSGGYETELAGCGRD